MAIPQELAHFTTEETFRDQFLVPLFLRLGFSVHNYHGTREYGKDLILGKFDEFCHRTYYGVQAKFEESIGQGQVGGLLNDVREAFDNPFRHPQDGTEQRITRFFVVNGGSLSDQARDNFFNGIHEPARKANTNVFDGKALVYLDRFATFSRNSLIREHLTAIQLELRINRQLMTTLETKIHEHVTNKGPYPVVRLRTQACAGWLEKPPLTDANFYGMVNEYFLSIQMLNYIADSIDQLIHAPDYLAARSNGFKAMCETAQNQDTAVNQQAALILRELSPLT